MPAVETKGHFAMERYRICARTNQSVATSGEYSGAQQRCPRRVQNASGRAYLAGAKVSPERDVAANRPPARPAGGTILQLTQCTTGDTRLALGWAHGRDRLTAYGGATKRGDNALGALDPTVCFEISWQPNDRTMSFRSFRKVGPGEMDGGRVYNMATQRLDAGEHLPEHVSGIGVIGNARGGCCCQT